MMRKPLKIMPRGKKGISFDIFPMIALIFGVALALTIVYFVFIKIQAPLGTALQAHNPEAVSQLGKTQNALKLFSSMYPFFLVGLILWVVIAALFIRSYPFFFWIGVFILGFAILVGAIFANVHKQMIIDNPDFAEAAQDTETMNWVVNQLPYIVLVVFCLTAFALWAKPDSNGGYV